MEFQYDNDLQSQLEILKEKLKNKEKEISLIILSQKEEYEKIIKERDEEVTSFVDNLVKENQDLKKNNINLEIDLENYKERITSNENCDDRMFQNNLKKIKEMGESAQNEIITKYEKYNKILQKEHKQLISNIRKVAHENKQKIIMNEENNQDEININKEENLIPLSNVEEQFNMLENRINLLQEDLKTKEKYSIIIEQKYEMMNEENKMIRHLIQMEKNKILEQIENIQKENSSSNTQFITTINNEINLKKENLENEINNSLRKSEDIINNLIQEKTQLANIVNSLTKELNQNKKETAFKSNEKEELEALLHAKENEIKDLNKKKTKTDKELKKCIIDKELFQNANNELALKINEYIIKISKLETENKIINDSINKELEKYDQRYKIQVDSLVNQVSELNHQLREYKIKYDEIKATGGKNDKKVLELNEALETNMNLLEQMKSQLRENTITIRIMESNLEETKAANEKLQIKNSSLEEDLTVKFLELKTFKEKLVDNEIEIVSLKKDVERITKIKEELSLNLEESKKNQSFITTQHDTLKMTNNIEIQRLKNQISELEKTSEKYHKVNLADNSFDIKKELRELKQGINKLYKTFHNKLSSLSGESIQTLTYEEIKMIEEVEIGLDKLISLGVKKENNKKSGDINPEVVKKYEEDIRSLKNKLNTIMQITSSIGNKTSENSLQNYNKTFKSIEKDNSNSLYESIIICLRNTNLTYLLDIFKLNILREEEIISLVSDKTGSNKSNYMANIKKQFSDLNTNYLQLKKLCEQAFTEYQQRAKLYLQPGELEKILEEYRIFTNSLPEVFFERLMKYQVEANENNVIFKMPSNDYNQLIEDISMKLDKFNKKINFQIETYYKNGSDVEKAVTVLIKNTNVEYDLVNSLMQEKFI